MSPTPKQAGLEPKWLRCQLFKLEWFQAPQIKKQLNTQPHTWQKRRPIRNTSQWSVTSFTSWRCAQPCNSTLYCTTLHLCIDCPMIYFEVAAQSTLSLSCGCCYNGFRQQSWGCILTVQTHVLHVLFWKNALRSFWACCRLFLSIKICAVSYTHLTLPTKRIV